MKNEGSTDVPETFVNAVRKRKAEVDISLRQLAFRADMDPATLSRILARRQNLPSNEAILRLAEVLEIKPPEQLLVEAGRIPESRSQLMPLMRAATELPEAEIRKVVKVARELARTRRSKKKGKGGK